MLRKDDPEFKAVVDKALTDVFASGEINSIYDKWFLNPIPPKNVNLNFEMSDNLKALIADPHDGAQPKMAAAYSNPPLLNLAGTPKSFIIGKLLGLSLSTTAWRDKHEL